MATPKKSVKKGSKPAVSVRRTVAPRRATAKRATTGAKTRAVKPATRAAARIKSPSSRVTPVRASRTAGVRTVRRPASQPARQRRTRAKTSPGFWGRLRRRPGVPLTLPTRLLVPALGVVLALVGLLWEMQRHLLGTADHTGAFGLSTLPHALFTIGFVLTTVSIAAQALLETAPAIGDRVGRLGITPTTAGLGSAASLALLGLALHVGPPAAKVPAIVVQDAPRVETGLSCGGPLPAQKP